MLYDWNYKLACIMAGQRFVIVCGEELSNPKGDRPLQTTSVGGPCCEDIWLCPLVLARKVSPVRHLVEPRQSNSLTVIGSTQGR